MTLPNSPTIAGVKWIELGAFDDARGKLRFGEVGKQLPFAVQRVYFSYDVPAGEVRAGVMHRALEQVVIAVGGALTFVVDDGATREEYVMEPGRALYVPPMVWREAKDFAPGAVCLVLASLPYEAAESVKDYQEFLRIARK